MLLAFNSEFKSKDQSFLERIRDMYKWSIRLAREVTWVARDCSVPTGAEAEELPTPATELKGFFERGILRDRDLSADEAPSASARLME